MALGKHAFLLSYFYFLFFNFKIVDLSVFFFSSLILSILTKTELTIRSLLLLSSYCEVTAFIVASMFD